MISENIFVSIRHKIVCSSAREIISFEKPVASGIEARVDETSGILGKKFSLTEV